MWVNHWGSATLQKFPHVLCSCWEAFPPLLPFTRKQFLNIRILGHMANYKSIWLCISEQSYRLFTKLTSAGLPRVNCILFKVWGIRHVLRLFLIYCSKTYRQDVIVCVLPKIVSPLKLPTDLNPTIRNKRTLIFVEPIFPTSVCFPILELLVWEITHYSSVLSSWPTVMLNTFLYCVNHNHVL